MHSSRLLRTAADKGGFLVPPRTSMDILASAANAVVSLFGSEDKRKLFAASVNSGVIVPEVLGQANLGYLRILALHHELTSPTLQIFNVQDFLEGVKPALEQFHQVQASLQNKLNVIAEQEAEEEEEETQQRDGDDKQNDEELLVEKAALAAYANASEDKRLGRLLKYSWKREAEKDPESYEGRLMAMVTPQFFEFLQVGAKTSYFMDPNVEFQDDSVEIHNVALLSARGMVIQSDDDADATDSSIEEAKQKVTDVEDESPIVEEEEKGVESDEDVAVAAQVEVLYDVQQSLLVPMAAKQQAADDEKTESDEDEKKEIARSSVVVGVFEGWLHGDPEGNELRWRVAEVRPAWEFPHRVA